MPDQLGEVIAARWRLDKLIGVGSLRATIWAASDLTDGLDAAIKLCPPVNPDAIERMLHGTSISAKLEHPNIARVYELGELDDGTFYCAMERLRGRTLARLVQQKPFTLVDGLRVADQVLAALELVHDQGVVHLDLKPGNVFIATTSPGQWRPVLLDFGIAIAPEPGVTPKQNSQIVGTPEYLPPEQIRGGPLDNRSDLYSFGVMLFRILTGRLPFAGGDRHEIYRAHLYTPPPRLSDADPLKRFPIALERIIQRAMAKEPRERWRSAAELREALATVSFELQAASLSPQTRRLSFPARQRQAAFEAAPPPSPPVAKDKKAAHHMGSQRQPR